MPSRSPAGAPSLSFTSSYDLCEGRHDRDNFQAGKPTVLFIVLIKVWPRELRAVYLCSPRPLGRPGQIKFCMKSTSVGDFTCPNQVPSEMRHAGSTGFARERTVCVLPLFLRHLSQPRVLRNLTVCIKHSSSLSEQQEIKRQISHTWTQ